MGSKCIQEVMLIIFYCHNNKILRSSSVARIICIECRLRNRLKIYPRHQIETLYDEDQNANISLGDFNGIID